MKKIVLSTYVVRDDNGIDVEATVRKFHSDVAALVSSEEGDVGAISNAVAAVFDRYPGASLKTDSVIHAALVEMHVGVETDAEMTVKTRKYLQANSGKREDGQLFRCGKGVGGGLCRWSEYVEKPSAK
jgi:hypothetical protein